MLLRGFFFKFMSGFVRLVLGLVGQFTAYNTDIAIYLEYGQFHLTDLLDSMFACCSFNLFQCNLRRLQIIPKQVAIINQ